MQGSQIVHITLFPFQLSDYAGWDSTNYLRLTRPQLIVIFFTYQSQNFPHVFSPDFDHLYWINIEVSLKRININIQYKFSSKFHRKIAPELGELIIANASVDRSTGCALFIKPQAVNFFLQKLPLVFLYAQTLALPS